MAPLDAARLGLANGDVFRFIVDEIEHSLPVKIQVTLCSGLLLVSAGLEGLPAMSWGSWAHVEKETLQQTELSN
jgi:NADH-quinone oxidoreductase subunit G